MGEAGHESAEHDGQCRTEARRCREAEGEGAGERVGEDGLHLQAGKAEAEANEDAGQRLRHAQPPEDGHEFAQAHFFSKGVAQPLPQGIGQE